MNPVDKTNPTKAHRARLCCLVMYMSGPTRNSYNSNLIPFAAMLSTRRLSAWHYRRSLIWHKSQNGHSNGALI